MKTYDKDMGKLFVDIVDFKWPYDDSWKAQKPKSAIFKLHFNYLDWDAFCACLSYYQSDAEDMMPYDANSTHSSNLKFYDLVIEVPIQKLVIGFGKVSFEKKFKWSDKHVLVDIAQAHMVPDLEYLKSYFSKALGKKTVSAEIQLKIENGEIEIVSANSEDLDNIDKDVLYEIKSYKVNNWKQIARESSPSNILIDVGKLDGVQEDFGNVDIFEREILFYALEDTSIGNRAQLIYLSNILLDSQKLILTSEPQFGFVFVINADKMVHCVWELLNGYSTYVWSFPVQNFTNQEFKLLEKQFEILTQVGRSHYLNNYRNTDELLFNIVQHKKSEDPIVDHFGKWRIELEKLFV